MADRRVHFANALSRFQGREQPIPVDTIDEFLSTYEDGRFHRRVACLIPLDERGRQPGTSVELMMIALGGRVGRLEAARVAASYWGWTLPGLDALVAGFGAIDIKK